MLAFIVVCVCEFCVAIVVLDVLLLCLRVVVVAAFDCVCVALCDV